MTPIRTQLVRRFSRLLGSRIGVFVAAALWLVPGTATWAQSPFISTDWSTYLVGEDITVTFKNTPGQPKDWVGIYPEGAVPGPVGSTLWYYVDGTQSGKIGKTEGTLRFAGGLNQVGTWFARFLLNDGYAELTNISFKVVEAGTPLVRPNKRAFASGEAISVTFTNGPGNPKDWLGFYPLGKEPGSMTPLLKLYVDGTSAGTAGQTAGTITFGSGLTSAGDYVVYLLRDNSNDVLASESLKVLPPPPPVLFTDRIAYLPGEDIVVTFKNTPGKPKDWVGIYPEGAVPGPVGSTLWYYVDGTQSGNLGKTEGTLTFAGGLNQPGTWFARFLLNDGYAELTNTTFKVVEPGTPLVRPNKRIFASSEAISVTFTNGPGNPKDWVGIYPAGQTPTNGTPLLKLFVDGTTSGTTGKAAGTLAFGTSLTTVGDYGVYFLLNNGTEVLASELFTVALSGIVEEYPVISASLAAPAGSVDLSKTGFRIRPYGTEANNPNTLAWTEDQLAGLHGPNLANLAGVDADGFLAYEGIINFARDADGQIGNFTDANGYPESPLPGFPGSQTRDSGTGNASEEVLTFLSFPAPGVYAMGVLSDDGFRVTTGANVNDKFAVVLGQNEGWGQNVIFRFRVEQAGVYPVRLIWENGGGGANLEWFTLKDDGTKVQVNDPAVAGAIKAYRVGPAGRAYVSKVSPAANQTSVPADTDVMVELTDGTDQVDPGSVKLQLTGSSATPAINKTGQVTQVTLPSAGPLPSGWKSQATLTYSTSSGVTVTNRWEFTVGTYVALPAELATPVGSGVTNKPGFRVRTYQISEGLQTATSFAEQQLAGLFGDNVADLSTAAADGYFALPAVINWNKDAGGVANEVGHFQGPSQPDAPIPGLPGVTGGSANVAAEILTYVEFPKAGYYSMGISCDDGFRLTPAEGPGVRIGALEVTAPAAIAGRYGAVSSGQENSGIALPLPKDAPIVGKLVYANPPDASTELVNTTQIQGNIALIDRGDAAVSDQVNRAQRAGATAVVIVSKDDLPTVVIGQLVNLPVVMIGVTVGERLKAQLGAGVTVSLGEDPTLRLAEHNYINYTDQPDDFLFGVVVPTGGVYPLRCIWYARGGGNRANLEWYTLNAAGQSFLVNDPSSPQALKAYRERTTPPPAPTLGLARTATSLSITFTGVLQSADKVDGPYNDMPGAASPLSVDPTLKAQFYRARK